MVRTLRHEYLGRREVRIQSIPFHQDRDRAAEIWGQQKTVKPEREVLGVAVETVLVSLAQEAGLEASVQFMGRGELREAANVLAQTKPAVIRPLLVSKGRSWYFNAVHLESEKEDSSRRVSQARQLMDAIGQIRAPTVIRFKFSQMYLEGRQDVRSEIR